jgi:hypothetical protein
MTLPRDIKLMVPQVVSNIKASDSTETAWLEFTAGAISAISGSDHWDNMGKVVDDLISFLPSSDRITAVVAAMLLGSTHNLIENPAITKKAITALETLRHKWVNEKPVTLACGVSLAELGEPTALKWFTAQQLKIRYMTSSDPASALKKIVIDYIKSDGWR